MGFLFGPGTGDRERDLILVPVAEGGDCREGPGGPGHADVDGPPAETSI
jgi:hypothetical protein